MKDRKIDIITNQMASYFGTITKAAFVAEMLDPTYDPSSDFFQPPDPNPEHKAANALLDLTEGGKTIYTFLTDLDETLKGAEEPAKLGVATTFRITFEPGQVPDDTMHMNGPALDIGQGVKYPPEKVFSIKEMLGISGDGENATINGKCSDPDRATSPNLSVTQIFPVAFGPGTQDTSALSLFLNAIPTVEFSRCVPFIDIVAITNSPPMTNVSETDGRISTIGLAQFLVGADKVKFGEASGIMASSIDADVFNEFEPKPK